MEKIKWGEEDSPCAGFHTFLPSAECVVRASAQSSPNLSARGGNEEYTNESNPPFTLGETKKKKTSKHLDLR